jgi:hypothetical protein
LRTALDPLGKVVRTARTILRPCGVTPRTDLDDFDVAERLEGALLNRRGVLAAERSSGAVAVAVDKNLAVF